MRMRGGRITRIAMPIKALAQRFAFALLLALSLALLAMSRADFVWAERARVAIIDVAEPLLAALSRPTQLARSAVHAFEEMMHLQEENQRLRQDNLRLQHWQQVALRLEQDNALLRRLLQVNTDPQMAFVTARVVSEPAGAFVRTVLLNAGQRDGLKRGDAVTADLGFVGRVIEAGQRAARVLLVTDLNSRIPIMVGTARSRGILAGDNGPMPRVEYLPGSAQVSVGDRVVTSGDGGLLPPGLAIGEVASVSDNIVRVRPLVDLARIEWVQVVRYEQPQPNLSPSKFLGPR